MPDDRIPCEVYSRVCGYLRPVGSWNLAKQREFSDRVPFAVPDLPEEAEDEASR